MHCQVVIIIVHQSTVREDEEGCPNSTHCSLSPPQEPTWPPYPSWTPEPPGNETCRRSRCKTCPSLTATYRFTSKTSEHSYCVRCSAPVRQPTSSTWSNARSTVYMWLPVYVGETEQALLNERINSHCTDICIRHNRLGQRSWLLSTSIPWTIHWQVMVIERVWHNDTVLRNY